VRLGTGQPAEVIEHELAGLVDLAELQSELAACMADFCVSDSAYKATLASLDRERRSARLKSLALSLAAKLDGGEPPESAAQAIADMAEVSRTRVADDVEAIGDNVHELFMGTDAVCVPLGLRALERVRAAAGALVVVGARPGSGKTAMLGTVTLAAARAGWRVLFLSLEMPAVQIRQRLLAGHARINLGSIWSLEARSYWSLSNACRPCHWHTRCGGWRDPQR
jgi:replicative DNA helicase